MKRCNKCSETFDDDTNFCLNDGTTLEFINSSESNSAETQIFFPASSKEITSTPGNKHLYSIIGAMATILIIALAAIIYLAFFRDNSASVKQNENNAAVNVAKVVSPSPKVVSASPSPSQTAKISTPTQTPPITQEAVRDLINRWENSQDTRNFSVYQTCYGQPFLGIKRTKSGSVERMNYGQWMNDRRKMLQNTVDVDVQDLAITIEGDTATVDFVQQFQSANYSDRGQKVLKIKMFPTGAKIIFEELKTIF